MHAKHYIYECILCRCTNPWLKRRGCLGGKSGGAQAPIYFQQNIKPLSWRGGDRDGWLRRPVTHAARVRHLGSKTH